MWFSLNLITFARENCTNMSSIKQLIEDSGGVLTVSELAPPQYRSLRKAVAQGGIVKVKQGVYAEPTALFSSMIDVERIVPRGIVCLYSAWHFYGLSMVVPPAFCIAIGSNRKVVIPDTLPVKLYYWKDDNLRFGVTQLQISGYQVQITDMERSVCDAVKYRNKVGVDTCAEVLRNYLKRADKNLTRLNDYAKRLRVVHTLNNYLEIALG